MWSSYVFMYLWITDFPPSSFLVEGGWSGGAMVPSKLSVLGRPTYFDSSMARA